MQPRKEVDKKVRNDKGNAYKSAKYAFANKVMPRPLDDKRKAGKERSFTGKPNKKRARVTAEAPGTSRAQAEVIPGPGVETRALRMSRTAVGGTSRRFSAKVIPRATFGQGGPAIAASNFGRITSVSGLSQQSAENKLL